MLRKISTSILLTSVAAATMLLAQSSPADKSPSGAPNAAQQVQHRVSRLTMMLNLSSDQQQQANNIFSKAATANATVHANMKTARENLAAAVKADDTSAITQTSDTIGNLTSQLVATNARAQADFMKILNPDQQTKYSQFVSQARNRFHARRTGAHSGSATR
jgi:Spy/CpxP family protein refolding chaperone